MIKKLVGETWKPLTFSGWRQFRNRYAVSDSGRIASYKKYILKDGNLLRGSLTTGYRTLILHRPDNKRALYIHREIMKSFQKKISQKYKYVIHINHNKLDNRIKNLRWATVEQMIDHQQESPVRIAYKKKQANRTAGLKLTAAQVKSIKNILNNKNRNITFKKLAHKYKVSEKTIYRIKKGKSWARI